MKLIDFVSRFKVTQKSYDAGETILRQGEVPKAASILKSGLVKIYSITKSGEERIVDFCVPGEILADAWVFGNTSSSIYYYQAIDRCETYQIPKETLLKYLKEQDLSSELLTQLMRNSTAAHIRLTGLEQIRARDKLLFTFYYLLKRFGKEIKPDEYAIDIRLTHQTIANLVGLTRETTTLELNSIKKNKILSYDKQKYFVNHSRLLQAIDEDSFDSITI